MILKIYKKICDLIEKEFCDIVAETYILKLSSGEPQKLRLILIDDTFIDVWISVKGKYSFHWELRPFKNKIFRCCKT